MPMQAVTSSSSIEHAISGFPYNLQSFDVSTKIDDNLPKNFWVVLSRRRRR